MAEGDGAIYNNFKETVMEGIFDLSSAADALKLILVSGHTPSISTHEKYADVSGDEYGAGLGYTVGGETLTSQDVTQVDGTSNWGKFDAADVTWTSLGTLSPAQPTHAILYDDDPTIAPADPLIAYWVLGTTATNGGNYTIEWGSDGIITLA